MSTKTVLITGATSGIGKATAYRLALSKMQLIICGRRTEELEAFYWGLVLVYWKLLGIEIEENVDLGGHDTDDDLAEQIQYTMRIDDIYNDVQQRSGIPFEHFNVHQDQIKVWIKKRCRIL